MRLTETFLFTPQDVDKLNLIERNLNAMLRESKGTGYVMIDTAVPAHVWNELAWRYREAGWLVTYDVMTFSGETGPPGRMLRLTHGHIHEPIVPLDSF